MGSSSRCDVKKKGRRFILSLWPLCGLSEAYNIYKSAFEKSYCRRVAKLEA